MDMFSNFEGHRAPTENDIETALTQSMVVIDTNVLLKLYAFPVPARELAIKTLAALNDRLWVPHQVIREFWRHRAGKIIEARPRSSLLDNVRQEVNAVINGLRPDEGRSAEIDEIKQSVQSQLELLQHQIDALSGPPLDTEAILRYPSLDPVLQALNRLLDGKVGAPFVDESEHIKEGLRRFKEEIPPGYKDGLLKEAQKPEKGTGDYLLWRQTLEHLESIGIDRPFIIVTDDRKDDWRIHVDGKRYILGARPELVQEAISAVGQPVYVITSKQFYNAMSPRLDDTTAKDQLIQSVESEDFVDEQNAARVPEVSAEGPPSDYLSEPLWTWDAWIQLMSRLSSGGYLDQVSVIERAASSETGFVSRKDIYDVTDFDGDRSLKRFSVPASRITSDLVKEGFLHKWVAAPLVAVYGRGGQAIGYSVPEEFCAFQRLYDAD